jgi:hypothetical protein
LAGVWIADLRSFLLHSGFLRRFGIDLQESVLRGSLGVIVCRIEERNEN